MNALLRWSLRGAAALVVTCGSVLLWSNHVVKIAREARHVFPPIQLQGTRGNPELGRRIVMVRNGCVDCHGSDLGGAKIIDDSLMGEFWGPNISPAALGDWTDEEIARAIWYGVGRNGLPLVLMPSHDYQRLAKEDLASIIAFLRSALPVKRSSGPVRLGTLAKLLYATGRLPSLIPANGLIRTQAEFTNKPVEGPNKEFGKYLVATSCTGCHGGTLKGGPIPGAPPDWPPAASLSGLAQKHWSGESFMKTMRTGVNPFGNSLRPPMPVELTKKMTDVELQAIWLYLETVN